MIRCALRKRKNTQSGRALRKVNKQIMRELRQELRPVRRRGRHRARPEHSTRAAIITLAALGFTGLGAVLVPSGGAQPLAGRASAQTVTLPAAVPLQQQIASLRAADAEHYRAAYVPPRAKVHHAVQATVTVQPTYKRTYTAPARSATVAAAKPAPAQTHTATPVTLSTGSLGARLLSEAETRTGDPYVWGADGPSSFDCSGLVNWSARQMGITIGRDTYSMLAEVGGRHLRLVSTPELGDLAFYGTGHVELYVRAGETFGAQKPNTPVGFHHYTAFWHPTEYVRFS